MDNLFLGLEHVKKIMTNQDQRLYFFDYPGFIFTQNGGKLDLGMNIREKKKIGLVLSGGGIKAAAFHIGACLALKEKGFHFTGGFKNIVRQNRSPETKRIQLYVGSSAGAFISAVLASGYEPESLVNAFQVGVGGGKAPVFSKGDLHYLRPINYRNIFTLNGSRLLKFIPESIFKKSLVRGGVEAFLKNGFKLNGLFTTRGIESYLRQDAFISNDFSELGVELYVVATQLNHTRKAIFGPFSESTKTQKTKYINYAKISEAVACSTALPPFFAPYAITNQDGKEIYYYDGEIRDTLSAHVAADHGCDLIISSSSMQPYHFNPEMGSLHQYGIPVIINQALYQVLEQKINRHLEWQSNLKILHKELDRFFKERKYPEDDRAKVLQIIQRTFNFKPEVDYIHISPRPQDHEMFFVDHFSLNSKLLERIVKIGFKSTINVLRQHRIQDENSL